MKTLLTLQLSLVLFVTGSCQQNTNLKTVKMENDKVIKTVNPFTQIDVEFLKGEIFDHNL